MDFASRTAASLCLTCTLAPIACFSPNVSPDAGNDDGGTSAADTTAATSTSSTSTSPTTTTSATSTSPTTSDDATTDDPTSTSSPTSAETTSTSGPPDPFCGDGNVDDDEECDDGDANANTAACRADCTMAACGDANIWEGVEACDDGMAGNELEVGACAPDCSRVIEERIITIGELVDDGDLGANPVATMDGHCDAGYLALFAQTGTRQANDGTAFAADDLIDWPLQPFTAYVREDGELLWITDERPLLGVRNGLPQPLLAPIYPEVCSGEIVIVCYVADAMTSLRANWTVANSQTCNGWSSSSENDEIRFGNGEDVSGYLAGGEVEECDFVPFVVGSQRVPYCVEQ